MINFIITLFLLISVIWFSLAGAEGDVSFMSNSVVTKKGAMPSCTPMTIKETRGKVILRDINKSWPRVKMAAEDFERLTKFSDFSTCIENVEDFKGRYEGTHLTSFMASNLIPGMPSEFALMLLGPPSQPAAITSYIDPYTGRPKSYRFLVWNNQQRRSFLGSALTIAGAATGMSAASGAIVATQAASIATSAAAAVYSLENLKTARVVTIQVNGENAIETFTSN